MIASVSVLVFGLLAFSPAAAAPIAFEREVEITGRSVQLGDVADVSRLPAGLRGRAAALPVTEFRPGQERLVLGSRRLAERARALMPALSPWLPAAIDSPIVVRLAADRRAQAAPARSGACVRVTHAVAAGATPTKADFVPSSCEASLPPGVFRYDPRARTLRATRDLEAGETLTAVPEFALAAVHPGQRLYVQAQVGPVFVEREVQAVQSARPGQHLFVRAEDGGLFTAAFSETVP
ncbi:MAG: hypothetical protein ABI655_02360 [Phenylobacterium sp.]